MPRVHPPSLVGEGICDITGSTRPPSPQFPLAIVARESSSGQSIGALTRHHECLAATSTFEAAAARSTRHQLPFDVLARLCHLGRSEWTDTNPDCRPQGPEVRAEVLLRILIRLGFPEYEQRGPWVQDSAVNVVYSRYAVLVGKAISLEPIVSGQSRQLRRQSSLDRTTHT